MAAAGSELHWHAAPTEFADALDFTRLMRSRRHAPHPPACRERVGKYFIQLCGTTPCMVNGSEEIKAAIEKHLHIKDGGACEVEPSREA